MEALKMSDLTATSCGCSNNSCGNNGIFGGNCIWILLLLFCGCGNNGFGGCGNDDSCDWLIWILLISCFCGNNSGCGNNNSGCGCGC